MSFQGLGLSDALLRALADKGYTTPTPIQARAIPAVLEGRDLLAAAQTGTGKTAAFVLPILQRLSGEQRRGPAPRVLILVPTRELAAQVAESVRDYGRHLSLRSTLVFGGVSAKPQEDALQRGVDLVIATPGRLLDHAGNRTINLSQVKTLVLDEADRMLDMGFIRDIKRVLQLLPRERQNLLFSATFSREIRELAAGLLHDPQSIDVAPRNTPTELVDHRVYHVESHGKQPLLSHILRSGGWHQTLVFTRTKHGANKLAAQLERDGIKVAAIHGNKSQNARTRALADFKANTIEVLVATDIAARGLDISELPHVVNYELPHVPEDYVHRIGRTGRAGCTGEAISLVARDERDRLQAIERVLGRSIPTATIEGAPVVPPRPPQQPQQPQQRQSQGQQRQGQGQGHHRQGGQQQRGRHGNQQRRQSGPSSSGRRPA